MPFSAQLDVTKLGNLGILQLAVTTVAIQNKTFKTFQYNKMYFAC